MHPMTPPPTMTTRDVGVGGDVETIARNCIAATRPFRSPKGQRASAAQRTDTRAGMSERDMSFRADPNCHSERTRTVIPSEAELSFQATPNCRSERSRTVVPSEAELSFRAKRSVAEESPREMLRLRSACRRRLSMT